MPHVLEDSSGSGGGGVRGAGERVLLLLGASLLLAAPSALEDSPVRPSEVGVAQSVADRVDGAVDIAKPVSWKQTVKNHCIVAISTRHSWNCVDVPRKGECGEGSTTQNAGIHIRARSPHRFRDCWYAKDRNQAFFFVKNKTFWLMFDREKSRWGQYVCKNNVSHFCC